MSLHGSEQKFRQMIQWLTNTYLFYVTKYIKLIFFE
jgi:hypothetical protein